MLLNWIANFLTDRQQRTRVGQFFSEWKFLNAGVPQGTKLGPLLFLIMILIIIKNNSGPSFVPCGTPAFKNFHSEKN